MYVIVRQLRHRFHNDREFLHARNIFDHVKLRPSDSDMPEEMEEQIVSGSNPVNVTYWRILCAWIGRHHHIAFFFGLDKLLCDVALNDLVREVPTQSVTTNGLDLETLLQRQPASLKAHVHKTRAGEIGIGEYSNHRLCASMFACS